MSDYQAPVTDLLFTLKAVTGLDALATLPGYQDATEETVQAVLEEAGRFAGEVLAPLNPIGDRAGCKLENGAVRTPEGFADAYRGYAEAGWNAVAFDPDYGGQGMPWALTSALQEIWNSANMAFALCPLLTQGAIEALQLHGTPEQKATYLSKMIAGTWTGTMNLTEPQAGTDLGSIRTRAEPANGSEGGSDGSYRIKGQKIFITYGEHDFAENIIHFVLARLPDAPAGSKGISLFIVPKFLPKADGSLGRRNDLRCVSLEHKLGINASPTCVMAYGDNEGATGYRVGEPHRGLEYMFTMMNNARLAVGIQGLAVAERAYQHAVAYARQRVQGQPVDGAKGAPILHHPDVRRNLLTMRALTEAMRCLALYAAGALDRAKRHPDAAERARNQALTDLLIPIVKAWCTDQGVRVASLGVQVHGGLGFIEQTGAAQYFRDARIAPIYEGTNGIQAMDLLGRKLLRDEGRAMRALLGEMGSALADFDAIPELRSARPVLQQGLEALEGAVAHLLEAGKRDMSAALAVATPFLALAGTVIGGWLLARAAQAAAAGAGATPDFTAAKLATATFFVDNILPEAEAEARSVRRGAASTLAFPLDAF